MKTVPGQHLVKVAYSAAAPNRRRGGDMRVLLSPRSAGATAGFLGAGTLGPGEVVTEHYHPYSEEYIYVVRGQLLLTVDGAPYALGANESAMVPKGARHRILNDGEEEMFAVYFLGPLAPRPELGHVDTEPLPGAHEPLPEVGGAE